MTVPDAKPRSVLRDVVLAAASLSLLGVVLWLGYRDYRQPWKQAERQFRDVEAIRSERAFIDAVPDDIDQYQQLQSEARLAREVAEKAQASNKRAGPVSVEASAELFERDDNGKLTKAEKKTFPVRIVDHRIVFAVPASDGKVSLKTLQDGRLEDLKGTPPTPDAPDIQVTLARAEDARRCADNRLEQLAGNLDRLARGSIVGSQAGKRSASQSLLDGFTSSEVHPIYPNIKQDAPLSARTDLCTTCHLGIDNSLYDRMALTTLSRAPEGARRKLRAAREIFETRSKNGEEIGFDPAQLPRKVRTLSLTSAQVGQFAAHPRLDLFVGVDSPHSKEKFGCTVCHGGVGDTTDFAQAEHTANDAFTERQWRQDHPEAQRSVNGSSMSANRFVESSCLKCHPQVTDLIRDGVKEEAPKLLKGYKLVRDLGCFGCHDINGKEDGRVIGPDMRLEPPQLAGHLGGDGKEPGTYRKVGPSLLRVAEKIDEEWVRRWLLAPRGFRPDTRMPHFYNLSTNNPQALTGSGQEKFPDAEIAAIAYYLFKGSEPAKELTTVFDHDAKPVPLPPPGDMKDAEVLVRARNLFTEKGCLACHSHEGTAKAVKDGTKQARITSEARFGPDLSRLASKITKTGAGGAAGRHWLVQWLLNPNLYHARTKMPITFLAPQEAADIADWLLSQPDPALDAVLIGTNRLTNRVSPEITDDEKDDAQLNKERQDRADVHKALVEAGRALTAFAREWTPYNLAEVNAEAAKLDQALAQIAEPLERFEDSLQRIRVAILVYKAAEKLQKAQPGKLAAPDKKGIEAAVKAAAENQQALLDLLSPVNEAAKALLQTTTKPFPTTDDATLRKLARDYLAKVKDMTAAEVDQILPLDPAQKAGIPADRLADLPPDEKLLEGNADTGSLKSYIGKKAISRLGCYGCHDVQGFGSDKPVGGDLSGWTRRSAHERVYNDSVDYVQNKYHITPLRATRRDLETRIRNLDRPARIRELEARLARIRDLDAKDASPAKLTDDEAAELTRLKDQAFEDRPELKNLKDQPPLTEEEKRELFTLKNLAEKDPWQAKSADGKPPFEKWYFEGLQSHSKEGFLHLKLADPRSFDYQQKRTWSERLRMPHYRFAGQVKRQADENDDDYATRVEKEEAEAREAVMTFVLGLTDEPVAPTFVNHPDADRQAEVRGRQILDKYNCAGCHVVNAGRYDIKSTPDVQARLFERYKADPKDFVSPSHNAWTAPPAHSSEHLTIHGMPFPNGKQRYGGRDPDEDGHPLVVRLTQAVRVMGPDGSTVDIPAGDEVRLPYAEVNRHDPYGGAFVAALSPYVAKKRPEENMSFKESSPTDDRDKARNFLPPPLLREGERVQSDWLLQFLLDPQVVRSYTILRMPRFNMSPEEARDLVDYFEGVARRENPGANLPRTFAPIAQQKPEFWENRSSPYLRQLKGEKALEGRLAELKPQWKLVYEERRSALDRQIEQWRDITNAEQKPGREAMTQARPQGVKAMAALLMGRSDLTPGVASLQALVDADKAIKAAQEALDKAQQSDNFARLKTLEKLRLELTWDAMEKELQPAYEKNAYAADGYRLLLGHGGNICLSCHQIGNLGTTGVAPRLDRVATRLRPEWTALWLARPSRMLAYSPKMNANFQHGETPVPSQNLFVGSSEEQIIAVRDVLMSYPWVADLPINRYYPVPGKFYQDATPKEVPK